MKKISAALLLSTVVAIPAFAADNNFYAGATLGRSNIGTPAGAILTKSTDTTWGVLGGYQFNKNWGAEVFYASAGKFAGTNAAGTTSNSGNGHAWGLVGVGTLPLSDALSVYGKLGIASVRTSASGYVIATGAPSALGGATRTSATYGLGGQYNINPSVDIRFGWDHYKAAVTGASAAGSKDNFNANVWALGAVFKF